MSDERACIRKHRWPDEMTARAGAIYSVENYDGGKLWVYKCPHCRGWHLTKQEQPGQEPAAQKELTK